MSIHNLLISSFSRLLAATVNAVSTLNCFWRFSGRHSLVHLRFRECAPRPLSGLPQFGSSYPLISCTWYILFIFAGHACASCARGCYGDAWSPCCITALPPVCSFGSLNKDLWAHYRCRAQIVRRQNEKQLHARLCRRASARMHAHARMHTRARRHARVQGQADDTVGRTDSIQQI